MNIRRMNSSDRMILTDMHAFRARGMPEAIEAVHDESCQRVTEIVGGSPPQLCNPSMSAGS
jgi:hypothetical protein